VGPNSSARTAPHLLGMVGAILLALFASACAAPTQGNSSTATPSSSSRVYAMKFFTNGLGWVITERGVRHRTGVGQNWAEAGPSSFRGRNLDSGEAAEISLTGSAQAWAAAFSATPSATVSRTTDGGNSWTASTLKLDFGNDEGAGAGRVYGLNSTTAWIMATAQSSASFERGVLYQTTNSGQTWKRLSLPIVGGLSFATASIGWLAGGPSGAALYKTLDGGITWRSESVPEQSAAAPWQTTVAPPTFFDSLHGVLPVQVRTSQITDGARLYFYTTTDGGSTWTAAGSPIETTQGGDIFVRDAPRLALVDSQNWLIDLVDGLRVTHDSGKTWSTVDTSEGDVRDAFIVSFATTQDGWVYLEKPISPCAKGQTCSVQPRLLRTADGGRTWSEEAIE
jgi:photosystem II stability/assembly factor-like uncharacterized protein